MAKNSKDTLDTLKHDTKDAVDEVKQRTLAAKEKVKRDVAGDEMPLHERVASNVKEVAHKTKAEIDAAKRDVRHG
jgi:hypothetical protein